MLTRLTVLMATLVVVADAQQATVDTARIAPIVVTATRAPLSAGSLPVAVTVISGEQLRVRGVTTVADALGDVASAYVAQSGSQGGTTSLFLRGGESKYVKVLVDGVPVNDPGGAYDFGSLTTDNVERIEVVRGPASVVYGADAVTGVVNIITRRATATSTDAEIRVGSAPRERSGSATPDAMHAWDAIARTTGVSGATDYSIALARHATTGLYALNNAYGDNVLSARATFAPTSRTDVHLALRYTDYQFNYPTNSGGTPVDSNAFNAQDRTVLGLDVEHRVSTRARATLSLTSSVNDGGTDDALDSPNGSSYVSQDKTRRRGAELRLQLTPGSVSIVTLGAQTEQEDQTSQSQGSFAGFPYTSLFRAARRNTAGYGEWVLTPIERVTATIGARLDDNERFGQFGTERVGLSWRVLSGTRLRATAGTAFREPSFFENYATGYVTGNPSLKPEHSRSGDVGIDHDLLGGRIELAGTLYAQEFRDMIDYSGDTASCGFSYCNIARARADGAELEIRGRLTRSLQASVSGSALRTRVLASGFDTSSAGLYRRGETLIRRPARTVAAQLSYAAGRLAASARVQAIGARQDRDFTVYPSVPVTLPAYERVDVGGEYALPMASYRSALTLHVENALNAHYQTIYNFLAPRRTVWVGARVAF